MLSTEANAGSWGIRKAARPSSPSTEYFFEYFFSSQTLDAVGKKWTIMLMTKLRWILSVCVCCPLSACMTLPSPSAIRAVKVHSADGLSLGVVIDHADNVYRTSSDFAGGSNPQNYPQDFYRALGTALDGGSSDPLAATMYALEIGRSGDGYAGAFPALTRFHEIRRTAPRIGPQPHIVRT